MGTTRRCGASNKDKTLYHYSRALAQVNQSADRSDREELVTRSFLYRPRPTSWH